MRGLVYIFAVVFATVPCVNACEIPDIEFLEEKWERVYAASPNHYSLSAAKPFLELSQNQSRVYYGTAFICSAPNTYCQPATGNPKNPLEKPLVDPNEDISRRSICPWTYHKTINNIDRYPHVLYEAKCLCQDSSYEGCPCQDVDESTSSCEAVVMRVPILVNTKLADPQGKCIYRAQLYALKTGCACAKKVTVKVKQ